MAINPQYKVVIADIAGTALDEVPASNLEFAFTLNGFSSCSFLLPVRHPKSTRSLITPGSRTVYIYRKNVLVWGGYLERVQVSDEENLQVGSDSWLVMLGHRHIDVNRSYSSIEQQAIAWDLINWTQGKTNGNMGITRWGSEVSSGVTRNVTFKFWERRKILDVISEMSALDNGFDFFIDPNKVWKVKSPSWGVTQTNIVFEYGKNVSGVSYQHFADNVANVITGLGAGDGNDTCISEVTDSSSETTYGLREDSISYSDIKQFANLTAKANEELRIRKTPRWQPEVAAILDQEFDWTAFDVGDTCLLRVNFGYLNINQNFRIISKVVAITNEGRETCTVFFDDKAAP